MFGLLSKAGGGNGGGRERSGTGGRKGALTVFGNDGTVLEYHRRVRCSEVLASHPNHLVCPANAVKQQGGMLTAGEFLELGRVYFLLPNPARVVEEEEDEEEEQSCLGPPADAPRSAQPQEQRQQVVAGPVQFVISKAQLTQILGEATRAAGCAQTPGRKPVRASRRSRSKQQHWVASLESIPEYVAI